MVKGNYLTELVLLGLVLISNREALAQGSFYLMPLLSFYSLSLFCPTSEGEEYYIPSSPRSFLIQVGIGSRNPKVS